MEEKKSRSFEENFKKLEKLSQELQENKISVDELVPRMRDALSAIRICKDVLRDTELQLKEIQAEFHEEEKGT